MRILVFLATLFGTLPGHAGEAVCGISLGIRDNAWVDAGRRKDGPLSVMRIGIGVMHRLSRDESIPALE